MEKYTFKYRTYEGEDLTFFHMDGEEEEPIPDYDLKCDIRKSKFGQNLYKFIMPIRYNIDD
jgi:hypothetical protein